MTIGKIIDGKAFAARVRAQVAAGDLATLDILPRLKSGDSYGAHPDIEPE